MLCFGSRPLGTSMCWSNPFRRNLIDSSFWLCSSNEVVVCVSQRSIWCVVCVSLTTCWSRKTCACQCCAPLTPWGTWLVCSQDADAGWLLIEVDLHVQLFLAQWSSILWFWVKSGMNVWSYTAFVASLLIYLCSMLLQRQRRSLDPLVGPYHFCCCSRRSCWACSCIRSHISHCLFYSWISHHPPGRSWPHPPFYLDFHLTYYDFDYRNIWVQAFCSYPILSSPCLARFGIPSSAQVYHLFLAAIPCWSQACPLYAAAVNLIDERLSERGHLGFGASCSWNGSTSLCEMIAGIWFPGGMGRFDTDFPFCIDLVWVWCFG